MKKEDEVDNVSSFAGSLHLLFSLVHQMETIIAGNSYDELILKNKVLDWIAQDFLCVTSDLSSTASIELVHSDRMNNDCRHNSLLFNNRRRRLRRQKSLNLLSF